MAASRHQLLRLLTLLAFTTAALAGLLAVAAAAESWRAPVHPAKVTRAFSPPPNPYAAGHRGVDLAGYPGEPVDAAAAGEVSFAGEIAGRGVVVVVHGSLRTTYEPVAATVRRSTHVARGEEIGTLEAGHAGCPVSACLHWGLLRGEQYLDPMKMLQRSQLRLLPPNDQAGVDAVLAAPVSSASAAPVPPVAAPRSSAGASPIVWSAAALAGGGLIFALRRS